MDKIPYTDAPVAFVAGDADAQIVSSYDRLGTIFRGQRTLMHKYYEQEIRNGAHAIPAADYGDLQSRTVQMRMHEVFGFLVRELSEAMQELDASKPWKDKPRPIDEAKFHEEMADSFHFFVEMCITAGISPDSLFTFYFSAWEKNRGRQDTGY